MILALVLLIALLGVFYLSSSREYKPSKSANYYANLLLDGCSNEDAKESCYLREVSLLMEVASLEEAFAAVEIAQQQDEFLMTCHTIGHVIGQKEVEKDPGNWVDVIGRCPDFTCSDGCPHGAVIGRFGEESLSEDELRVAKEELALACGYDGSEESLSPQNYKCLHGVGHLTMFLEEADVGRALDLCESISGGDDNSAYSACSEGVFMIIHQPLGVDQEDLVRDLAPTLDTLDEYCSNYEGLALRSCYNEAFVLLEGKILEQSEVEKFCSYSNDENTKYLCLETLYMTAAKIYLDDGILNDFVSYCMDATDENKENCIDQGVVKVLQQDLGFVGDVLNLCSQIDDEHLQRSCQEEIGLYFPATYLKENYQERSEYCSQLPSEMAEDCLEASL